VWSFVDHSQALSEDRVPVLPTRALLVAPTVERAASLGTAFDDVLAATPAEVPDVLVTQGHDLFCVVISGVPTRGGRLASVIEPVLESCPAETQVLLDVSHPVGADLRDNGAEALRGLALVDCHTLAGVPCLRFRPAADRDAIPDLHLVAELLDESPDPRARPLTESDRLTARIVDLERELAAATAATAAATASLEAAQAERDSVSRTLERLRAHPLKLSLLALLSRRGLARVVTVALGLVVVGSLCVVVGTTTDSGYSGDVLTALLGLVCIQMAQVWVYDRRGRGLARRFGNHAKDAERRSAATEKRLVEMANALAGLERNVAVLGASSVDTAAALAELRHQLRTQGAISIDRVRADEPT
jgi:cell division septum initiation protein DivIVA